MEQSHLATPRDSRPWLGRWNTGFATERGQAVDRLPVHSAHEASLPRRLGIGSLTDVPLHNTSQSPLMYRRSPECHVLLFVLSLPACCWRGSVCLSSTNRRKHSRLLPVKKRARQRASSRNRQPPRRSRLSRRLSGGW